MKRLPSRDDIHVGSIVHIICKNDQKNGNLTKGIVKKILTKSYNHPYGIKVELEDDNTGRVQEVIKQETDNFKDSDMDESNFISFDNVIIPETENVRNEFKEFYQYDEGMDKIPNSVSDKKSKIKEKLKIVQKQFIIAICAFGNSNYHGFIHLGVNTNGKIVGLDRDKRFGQFSNYTDEFANHIRDTIENHIHDKSFVVSKLQIEFIEKNDKTICIIQVLPSDKPLFINDKLSEFYVRGPSPRAEHLDGNDMLSYIKNRFPNSVM